MRFLHFFRCNRVSIFINPKSEKNAFLSWDFPMIFFHAARLPPLIPKSEQQKSAAVGNGAKFPACISGIPKAGKNTPAQISPFMLGLSRICQFDSFTDSFLTDFFYITFWNNCFLTVLTVFFLSICVMCADHKKEYIYIRNRAKICQFCQF